MEYTFGDPRLPARIWAKIRQPAAPDECWTWTAAMTNGYGYVSFEGRNHNAHRAVYMALVDHDIDGLDVDHLCHGADTACPGGKACPHRACVNPSHLEAVLPSVNKLRGRSPLSVHAAKTHCPKGHPLSGDNLWIDNGGRTCRICRLARSKEWRERNRDKYLAGQRKYRDMTPEQKAKHAAAVARYKARKKAERETPL